jgi:hypothetical protein
MQQPSVGRVVHYVSPGTPVRADGTQAFTAQCRAAIVTEVGDPDGADADLGRVGLCVLNPTGQFFHALAAGGCRYADEPDGSGRMPGGTWHWPERV